MNELIDKVEARIKSEMAIIQKTDPLGISHELCSQLYAYKQCSKWINRVRDGKPIDVVRGGQQ